MINYNEMFKINENCKTKIEKVENHTVLTIDNFYKYPNKIYVITVAKHFLSGRNRTSDPQISMRTLQSDALPIELR